MGEMVTEDCEPIAMAAAEIDDSDIRAVLDVLQSGRLALGPKINEFERRMAEYVGVEHAIAVSSGTSALHLIALSLGLGPGDEVLVPSFTFAASVNAIFMVGATPVFVDIEEETLNLDPRDLERKITPRTRGIMAVDVFGNPANWDAINRIAEKHRLVVIDDCCEALGAEYRGKKLGGFGDAGAFAFYPNKQITTGEGGMIVTNRADVAELSQSLRNQGRGKMGAWLEHERLGYNYRLDEISAALGASQLTRIEAKLARRAAVAEKYAAQLADLENVLPPVVKGEVRMSWFVYVVRVLGGDGRERAISGMEQRGIPTRAYFSPIHLQPYVTQLTGKAADSLPVTERVASQTVALPFHELMTDEQIYRIVEALRESLA
jgi:perosamine synthetase